MAIDKLIPQYLNRDDDERILKSYEMVDALNVRISHEEDGDAGVIKNVEGNQSVAAKSASDTIPATGLNKVIGAVSSEAHKCIYFFLYNGNGNHGIYKYTALPGTEDSDVYQKVYESSSLNFNLQGYVSADLIVNQNGEHLLYFTDNRNEPRKINATKAVSGAYSDLINNGTDDEKELFLSVCKQPPLKPPTFVFNSNSALARNQLNDKVFQFAYQYVYDDGEVSALSPYSKLAISSNHLAFNNAQRAIYDGLNNEIEITVDNNKGPVKKIRLYARKGNGGYFVKVAEVNNIPDVDTQSVVFRNDGLYNQLDENTANKPFDSVPRLAGAQTFSNNRLFYGNYVEGFDNIQPETLTFPVYYDVTQGSDISVDRGDVQTLQQNEGNLYYRAGVALGSRYDDYEGEGGLGFPHDPLNDFQMRGTGKPISFGIDISNINSNGIADDATLAINVGLNGDAIGIVNISAPEFSVIGTPPDFTYDYQYKAFEIPITLFQDGTQVDHAGTAGDGGKILFMSPHRYAFPDQSNGYATYNFTRHHSLNNLQMLSAIEVNEQIEVSAGTTRDEIGQMIVDKVNGTTATVAVASKMVGADVDRAALLAIQYTNHSKALQKEVNFSEQIFSENVYTNPGLETFLTYDTGFIWIEWKGEFTFSVDASYDEATSQVSFVYRLEDVNIEAESAKTWNSTYLPNDKYLGSAITGHSYSNGEVVCSVKTTQNFANNGGGALKDGPDYACGIRDVAVFGSAQLVSGTNDTDKNRSFKSGASHEFGLVYFDDRNRSGGVQKLGALQVAPIGSPRRNGRNGRSEIDIRLMHDPPDWAVRWAPVYSKNTTYEKFLQFTVAEAMLPNLNLFRDILSPVDTEGDDSLKNSRKINSALGDDVRSAIFLSMRTLEGKNSSYKEFKGGNVNYQYTEGDILRVVSYVSKNGTRVYPNNVEFTVTGYTFFNDDENNPLVVSQTSTDISSDEEASEKDNAYRRTGWFLSIRDNSISGFDRNSVQRAKDYFSQGCVVEIMTPKKSAESQVYYEIGESFPIVTANGKRTHGGSRGNTSQGNIDMTVTSESFFVSSKRLYLGDKVLVATPFEGVAANASGFVFVSGVAPVPNGYRYFVDPSNNFVSGAVGESYTGTVPSQYGNSNSAHYGVVTLRDGDVYYRSREMLVNAKQDFSPTLSPGDTFRYNPTAPRKQDYERFDIEDASVSDFFESNSYSTGRPHIETPEQARMRRTTSITYSDPFAFDSTQLNLSSFNPSLFPYHDMPSKHGDIAALIDGNESLTVLQESKVSLLPIDRNVVELGGDSNMVASTNVIGTPTFMSGSYGPGNSPEGVIERFGQVYFSDARSGVVCRIDGGGIVPISSEKMESYFEGLFGGVNNAVARPRIPSGFDPENGEYIITTEPIDFKKFVINQSTVGYAAAAPDNATYTDIKVQPKFATDLLLSWDTEKLDWDEADWATSTCIPKWDDMHQGIIFLDRVNETSGVYIDPVYETSGASIRIDTMVEGQLYRGSAHISLQDFTVEFCQTLIQTIGASATQYMDILPAVDPEQATIAWSPAAQKWLTFYSFIPDLYANVQNRFFSFKDGQMWYHNKLSTRNSFYGDTYRSELELISKGNPSSIKFYKAMSLEGNANWKTTLSNEKQQAAVIETSHWNEKEGLRYANIPRVIDEDPNPEITTLPSSAYRVVGTVDSVDGTSVTFTSNVNKSPVITGPSAKVYRHRSGVDAGWVQVTGKISALSNKNTVSFTSDPSADVQAGDIIANVYSGGVNGDTLRSYYTKVKLENEDSEARELYAVNLVYESSTLHNDGGQPNNQ